MSSDSRAKDSMWYWGIPVYAKSLLLIEFASEREYLLHKHRVKSIINTKQKERCRVACTSWVETLDSNGTVRTSLVMPHVLRVILLYISTVSKEQLYVAAWHAAFRKKKEKKKKEKLSPTAVRAAFAFRARNIFEIPRLRHARTRSSHWTNFRSVLTFSQWVSSTETTTHVRQRNHVVVSFRD